MRYLLLLSLCFCTATIYAQQNGLPPKKATEMNVDLPDETEETDLVEQGQLQLETQMLYNKFSTGDHAVIGQSLLRYGIAKRWEARLLVEEGYERDMYEKETVQATYPLAASLKFVLLKDHDRLPDITLVSYLKLPFTGRKAQQNLYWSPIFMAAFQHKMGDKWKLEYNAGIQQEAFSTEWVALVNASIHYKIIEDLECFAEYYAQYANGDDPHHNAGLGLAYQLGQHFEFYACAGSSIQYAEPNKFISGGVAVRLPK